MQSTRFGIKDTALSLIDDSEEEEEEENKGLIVRAKGTTQPKALKEKRHRMCLRNWEGSHGQNAESKREDHQLRMEGQKSTSTVRTWGHDKFGFTVSYRNPLKGFKQESDMIRYSF